MLFAFLVAVELVAVPAFALLLLGPSPWPALPGCSSCSLLADVGARGRSARSSRALAVQTRARDLIVPLLALPLLVPLVIAAARGARAAAARPAAPGRSQAAGWPSWPL